LTSIIDNKEKQCDELQTYIKELEKLVLKDTDKIDCKCTQAIKNLWAKGTESKHAILKCDRVQLTSMLASKSYDELLVHFLDALE
jgi:hypothetical protein